MISFVSHLKLAGVAELLDHTSGGALKSISLVESMGQDFLAEAAEETFHEVDHDLSQHQAEAEDLEEPLASLPESSSEPFPKASQALREPENDLAGQLSALLSRRGGPIEVGTRR